MIGICRSSRRSGLREDAEGPPMTLNRANRLPILLAMAGLLAMGEGCAHRRQVYYANDIGPQERVHIRAPFVDIQVNKRPKLEAPDRLSRHDDDDDDDDRD